MDIYYCMFVQVIISNIKKGYASPRRPATKCNEAGITAHERSRPRRSRDEREEGESKSDWPMHESISKLQSPNRAGFIGLPHLDLASQLAYIPLL